jgi:threonine dehydrogenase-like Zn-dependent dehydrogenase
MTSRRSTGPDDVDPDLETFLPDGPGPDTPRFSLGVPARGELGFFAYDLAEPQDGEALVRTLWSGVSAGTELTFVKGTDPAFTSRRDPELGLFVHGEPARRYPVTAMGYMECAEVVESRRDDLAVGQLVGSAYGHRSLHVLGAGAVVVPVPDGLDPVLGIYLAQMGPIAANGVLHAAAELAGVSGPARLNTAGSGPALGDGVRDRHVLVTGAGVVGLLTALFARRGGAAAVAVADPDATRLRAAEALGLQVVEGGDPASWCKQRWVHGSRDRGADLVFQCRGRPEVLHQALRALRPQGVVIDLAFYTEGAADLRLGEEFHHHGLTIRCAQIGRVPRGLAATWDRGRLAAETAALLLAEGPAVREHLVTDVVPVEQGPEVVGQLARRERHALQVVLDFTASATGTPAGRPGSR